MVWQVAGFRKMPGDSGTFAPSPAMYSYGFVQEEPTVAMSMWKCTQLIHIMTNVGTRMSKPIHLGMATIPPTKMVMTHGHHGILSTWTTKISGTRCRSARSASGSWPFYPLPVELRVKPPILIPRPETEELVDRIINDFKEELGPRRLGHLVVQGFPELGK